MDDFTLNLIKFGLDIQSTKQSVAAQNIARADKNERMTVDFSAYLEQLDFLSKDKKHAFLQVFNSNAENLTAAIETQTDTAVNIEAEHADSTKAMLEYQALVEALNRRLSIRSLVIGGGQR